MESLNDFLLERILEEEALANAAIDAHDVNHVWRADPTADSDRAHIARWNPWRVLTTSVGMRLLVAAHRDVGAGLDRRSDPDGIVTEHACSTCGQYDEYAVEWPCYTLRVLALGWVDHPSYRQEWRPRRLNSGVSRAPAPTPTPTPPAPEQHIALVSDGQQGAGVPPARTRSGVA